MKKERKGGATLLDIKASYAKFYQGIEESKKKKEEIKRSLKEGTMIKL